MAHALKLILIDYGIKIKNSHEDFKKEINNLISIFNQKGIN